MNAQSGFCPRCGDFAQLVREHRDDGREARVMVRGPLPLLYCRRCVADLKALKAAKKRERLRLYGR